MIVAAIRTFLQQRRKRRISRGLPCIVCGEQLLNCEYGSENQPEHGLAFTTHGHWPSSIIDIFDGFYLEINVCNLCLLKAAKQNMVARGDSDNADAPLELWKLEDAI